MVEAGERFESEDRRDVASRRSQGHDSLPVFRAELRQRLSSLMASTAAHLVASEAHLGSSRVQLEELRQTITQTTRVLKSAGEPPERVLHAVKEALREELNAAELPPRTRAQFMSDAVQWCIDAYFAAA
jgi:hypothetical protein